MRQLFSDEGVVLRKRSVREKDEVVVLMTKDHGKRAFVSYGSRDPKSRKAGALQLFNTVQFTAKLSKGGMPAFEQVKLLRPRGFQVVSEGKNLDRYYRASRLVQLVSTCVDDEQIVQSVYFDLNKSLDAIEVSSAFVVAYIRLLDDLGYLPQWTLCNDCHQKFDLSENLFFSEETRGFVHQACSSTNNGTSLLKSVAPDILKVMAYFQQHPIEEAIRVDISDTLLQSVDDLLEGIDFHGS